jgi:hypothetical protein
MRHVEAALLAEARPRGRLEFGVIDVSVAVRATRPLVAPQALRPHRGGCNPQMDERAMKRFPIFFLPERRLPRFSGL